MLITKDEQSTINVIYSKLSLNGVISNSCKKFLKRMLSKHTKQELMINGQILDLCDRLNIIKG